MKLNTYKNYRTCNICHKELPLTRVYFRRVNLPGPNGFHNTCRECEDKHKKEKEWHDGKLLCHCCGEYKNIEEFSKNGGTSEIRKNRRGVCKSCYTKRQKKHDINLEEDKKLTKCLRFRVLGARERAQKNSISFDITLDYIMNLWKAQKGLCALSGIPMTFELKTGRIPTNVSIDKIDRFGGYTKNNVQLVCMACNQIKSDLTEEEMYNFCKKIIEKYENKNT